MRSFVRFVWRLWSIGITVLLIAVSPLIARGVRYVYIFDIAPYVTARSTTPSEAAGDSSSDVRLQRPTGISQTYHLSLHAHPSDFADVFKHYALSSPSSLTVTLFTTDGKPHEVYIERLIKKDGATVKEVVQLLLEGIPHSHGLAPDVVARDGL